MEASLSQTNDVAVIVEQEGVNRYRVLSSHLEQIGDKLRGKQKFSIFYSIILPVIVSAATLIFSSVFQYVSWLNSVNTKTAANLTAKASTAYENAVDAVSKRYYATFLFLPTVRSIVNRKGGHDSRLYNLDLELNHHRFNGYYEQIQNWNEHYDQILTAIDYNLDRPIFADADRAPLVVTLSRFIENKSDCSKSLLEIVEGAGYYKNSLKAQFAAINYCFVFALAEFNKQKDEAILNDKASIDPEAEKAASQRLSDLNDLTGSFRCHALLRLDYYSDQGNAVVSVWSFIKSIFKTHNKKSAEAQRQFGKEESCRAP